MVYAEKMFSVSFIIRGSFDEDTLPNVLIPFSLSAETTILIAA